MAVYELKNYPKHVIMKRRRNVPPVLYGAGVRHLRVRGANP